MGKFVEDKSKRQEVDHVYRKLQLSVDRKKAARLATFAGQDKQDA